MSEVPSATAESKGTGRRFPRWRRLLLGIASLSFVCGLAYCIIWVRKQPPGWVMDHDRASYARISKVIAADPRPYWNTRLCDFLRELDLEDVPWDNVMDQHEAGSARYYHFRGFRLCVDTYVPQEYWQHGNIERMLREEGSAEEKRQAREILRIYYRPSVLIDGISSREERMRQYEEELRQDQVEFNRHRHSPP